MNVFFLDNDPRQCAEWMVDKHVVKMILETAQLLSTAHRVIDGMQVEVTYKTPDKWMDFSFEGRREFQPGKTRKKKVWILDDSRNDILYNATHINHPSAVWCRQSVENYNWLVDHLFALADEYTYRYGKRHATMAKLGYEIQSPPHGLRDWDWTEPPSCMDERFTVGDDTIENYRSYYINGKAHIKKYTKRNPPYWWPE